STQGGNVVIVVPTAITWFGSPAGDKDRQKSKPQDSRRTSQGTTRPLSLARHRRGECVRHASSVRSGLRRARAQTPASILSYMLVGTDFWSCDRRPSGCRCDLNHSGPCSGVATFEIVTRAATVASTSLN